MSLTQNITMLTRPHPHTRPDGRIVTRAAFLDQLANAQMSQRRGGAGTNETRIPINTAAIELWKALDTEARQLTLDRYNHARGPIGALIQRWDDEGEPTWRAHFEHVTQDMIDRIEAMFDPPPKRRALHQPCPACGETWALSDDGDRAPCLTAGTHRNDGTMRPPGECDASCDACGAAWEGEELAWLLKALLPPARETTTV